MSVERSAARWLALLELAYETVLVRSVPEDRILYWSNGASTRYGWSAAEALGRVSHELLQTRASRPVSELLAQLHERGRWEGEVVHLTRDGRERIMEVRWDLWRNPATGHAEVLEIGRDVTELRFAEAERQRLFDKARALQRFESLAALASGAAHDFNNLMMAVVANADAAALDIGPDHPAHPHLVRIDAAARHAAEITDRLRDFAGERRRVRARVRVDELAAGILEVMRATLPEGVATDLEVESERRVHADPVALRQVLLNLVTNAIEASPPGTRIRVRVDEVPDAADCELLLDPQAAGPFLRVRVSDAGAGITEDTRRRIFEPFFSTKAGGRGLGLALVMGLVRAHGGGLGIDTAPGVGTVVTVLVPAGE